MPGDPPATGVSHANAAATNQTLTTSSDPRDVAQAQTRISIPTPINNQIRELEGAQNLTPRDAQEGLSRLYVPGSNQDVSVRAAVREALDQAAPAILGRALIPPESVEALAREFKLSGQGREALSSLLAQQIGHLLSADSATETGLALNELRGTEEILKGAGLLDDARQELFAVLQAAGANKQQKIEALQARAEAEAARQATGVVSDRLEPITEPSGSVLARSLGMSVLHATERAQETGLTKAQKQLAITQKRLDRIASSKETHGTHKNLQEIMRDVKGDSASLARCQQFSTEQKASLAKRIEALQTGLGTPAAFGRAVATLERQAEKRLTEEDSAEIKEKIDTLKQHANETFRAAVTKSHEGVAGAVLAEVLAPAGFNERIEAALTKLSPDDFVVLDKALAPAATSAEKTAGREVLDRALADDPTVSDVLLAIKLARLTPDGERDTVRLAHARTEAFAEVAALMTQAGQPMLAKDVTSEGLDAWLTALAKGEGEGAVKKMGDADLLLIAARFAVYVEAHPDAAGKNPAEVDDFVSSLPQGYSGNPDLKTILGKGLVSSAQASSAMSRVESSSLNSSRVRSVLTASAPGADARCATAASNAFARLVTRTNLTDLDTPGQRAEAVRDVRQEAIQKVVARNFPKLTQQTISSDTTETANFTQQAAQSSAMEKDLRRVRGLKPNADIEGETLAVSLHAVQRLMARSLSDLSAGKLSRLGLSASNCTDPATLRSLIASIDWKSQPMDFEHSLLLSTFLKVQGKEINAQTLKAQMTELGIPGDSQNGVVELLTQSDQARKAALGSLDIFKKGRLLENKLYIRMDTMTSSNMGSNDADGQALKDAMEKFLTGDETKREAARETILNLLKKEVPDVGDRMEVADLILQQKDHSSFWSRLTNAQSSNTTDMQHAEGKKAGLPEGSPIWRSIMSDKVTLLNQGSRRDVANLQAQIELGKELLDFSVKAGISASVEDALSVSMLVQTAALDAYIAWTVEQEPSGGDTSLQAFDTAYRTDLAGKNGSALDTPVLKKMSANLQKFGLTESVANAFAFSYLAIGKAAGSSGLADLLDGAMQEANGLDLVHQHLTVRSEVPEAIARLQEVERQEQASLEILAGMKQGQSLELTEEKSIRIKATVPVPGANVALQLAAGLKNNLTIFRDGNDRASLLIGKDYKAGIGAAASVCNDILKVGAQVEGDVSTGVALTFDSDEACARFVAKLVNGQATRTDLAACAGIQTLWSGGVGAAVGLEVDVGKAIGASVVTIGVDAAAGVKFTHETAVGLEGKTVTSSSTFSVEVGAQVGLNTDELLPSTESEEPEETEIMGAPAAILENAKTQITAGVEGPKVSASAGLTRTVENKVLTDHAGAHVKQATSSHSTTVVSEAALREFLNEHKVAEPVRQDMANYMKRNGLKEVTVTCAYVLPGDLIQGRTLDEAMNAVKDASCYQLDKLTLSFEEGDPQHDGINTEVVTIRASATKQKTVTFNT
ncbi:hypothetical protein AGMMS49960_07520 [Betaproteobacteria bacterium]|nr:hypothetical protein AGMMS49543_05960 [Betaproteobacteria bacterium]GHU00146.1 hypothetical protein AGMMS49960_07520 [Betaproteobacteria bacterium]GHU21576.1 hypothetical protein AGMMS50243_19550 [Betaproteobacteria bacterium]